MKRSFYLSAAAVFLLVPASFYSYGFLQRRGAKGGLVTLYAKDPLMRTYSFTHMDYGNHVERGDVFFTHCELDFDWMRKGHFTAGILEGEKGYIVDLGTEKLEPDGIPLFYSLFLKGKKGYVKKKCYTEQWREVEDMAELYREWSDPLSIAPIEEGTTYCVRITNDKKGEGHKDIIVKLYVIEYIPSQRVTFRWAVL